MALARLLVFGSIAFVAVLAAVIWAAWNSADGGDIIADLLLLLGSATISGLLFWSKAKSPRDDEADRVLE